MIYRVISKDELATILSKHKEWLADNTKGERADLSSEDLRSADLSFADLRSADLRYADLRSANLRFADLSSADLSSANLRFADLSSADLRFANLSSADLRAADLRFADLRAANLSSADIRFTNLRSADLRSANLRSADLFIFQFHRDTAYFTLDGIMRIGCECLPISEWAIGYKKIGTKHGYSALEIKAYGDFIKLCLKAFKANAEKE